MAATDYEERTCYACQGNGTTYDSTNADKVNSDKSGTCHLCRGAGVTLHLTPEALLAEMHRLSAKVAARNRN